MKIIIVIAVCFSLFFWVLVMVLSLTASFQGGFVMAWVVRATGVLLWITLLPIVADLAAWAYMRKLKR